MNLDTDAVEVEKILHSFENDKNLSISKLTYDSINNMKYDMLERIGMTPDELETMMLKLSDYRYVEELHDIQRGAFIRYIPLKINNTTNNNDIVLKNGGFICDIKINNLGVQILCRNINRKMFQFNLDETLIFQKLTKQEEIVLSVFDYLQIK